jgi:hypothetical protein
VFHAGPLPRTSLQLTTPVTAAHLDFRLLRHGKAVNPLTQIFPPGPPVPPEFRADFERRRAELEMLLGAVTITTTTDD